MKQSKKVEIVAVGHAFELGERGFSGGAPSKDSVWGIAYMGDNVVTFSGRRTASKFRYKIYPSEQREKVLELANKKFAGLDNKKTEYSNMLGRETLIRPNLVDFIKRDYKKALAENRVNRNAMNETKH